MKKQKPKPHHGAPTPWSNVDDEEANQSVVPLSCRESGSSRDPALRTVPVRAAATKAPALVGRIEPVLRGRRPGDGEGESGGEAEAAARGEVEWRRRQWGARRRAAWWCATAGWSCCRSLRMAAILPSFHHESQALFVAVPAAGYTRRRRRCVC
jgi:hypothetical protein